QLSAIPNICFFGIANSITLAECLLSCGCGKMVEMANADKTAEPCVMVIFGATGDLTKRKLFPALYNLAKNGHLPEKFAIVGVGRQEMLSDEFRDQMVANLKEFAGKDADKK